MIINVAKAKRKLSIIATPIGNLKEISERAKETLNESQVIFCEDTKSTKKLLNLLLIKDKILVKNDAHNENLIANKILENINNEISVCLVSDAGYPLISDPGHAIVKLLFENNVAIEVINGPCALIHGLVASGQSSKRFTFIGFLPSKKLERRNELKEIENIEHTLIFYEAPHRILESLLDMKEVLGDRQISVCREMTKLNETIYKGKISEVINEINPIGEFVVVVCGKIMEQKVFTLDEATIIVKDQMKAGMKLKEACKVASKLTNIKSTEIYNNFNK